MPGIVCAIRGGPASQPTIDRAIALAQDTSLPLVFLYVVNLDFLAHTASSRIQTISREMAAMGEFILLAAQAKAEQAGVLAEGVVREGNVMEELVALCREREADYAVMGQPRGAVEDNLFTHELLRQAAAQMEHRVGVRVVVPGDES